jgi:hypothetical protein
MTQHDESAGHEALISLGFWAGWLLLLCATRQHQTDQGEPGGVAGLHACLLAQGL